MKLLYEIFLRAYYLGAWLSAPFNPKAKKWVSGRKKSFENLKYFAAQNPQNVWIHCASVGEFEQGIPLLEKLEAQFPEFTILLSFFSPSGYEYAAKKYPHLSICYLPLDTKRNAVKWIKVLRPRMAIFVKYEFWHHYFHQLKANNVPLLMVSAIFWEELFFFKNYAHFFRKALRQVSHFFVQDAESKHLLNNINLHNVTISGDTRFERVIALKESPFHDEKLEKFTSNADIFIFGSVWPQDVNIIKEIIANCPTSYKYIVAPHETEHFPYHEFDNINYCYYTHEAINANAQLLFIDTIGILSRAYRFSSAAYVGGGFGKGIHNILEAAVYNIPIFSGPNIQRFAEANYLQNNGMLTVFHNENEVQLRLPRGLNLPQTVIETNAKYFEANASASNDIIAFIKKHHFLD